MVEVLVVSTILGVIIAFTGTLIVQVFRSQKKDEASSALLLVRDSFADQFKDPSAWKEIRARNPTLTLAFTDITVYGSDGAIFKNFNPGIPTNGFDLKGQLCNTYNSVQALADPNCPFRPRVQWRQQAANTGSCAGVIELCESDIEIDITAEVSQGSSNRYSTINPDKFYMRLIRSAASATVSPRNCPAGQLVYGFAANGDPRCKLATTIFTEANPPTPPAVGSPGPAVGSPGPSVGTPAPAKTPAPAPKGK